MPQELRRRVRVGRDDDAVERLVAVLLPGHVDGQAAALVGRAVLALHGTVRPGRRALLAVRVRLGEIRERRAARQLAAALAPEPVEHDVVRLAVVAAADVDRGAGVVDRLAVAEVDALEGARERDSCREICGQPGRLERAAEADRLGEQAPPIDDAPAGLVGICWRAHRLRFAGLMAIADGNMDEVESTLRAAINAFDEWGSPVYRAKAQAELAHWLEGQHRDDEAAPLKQAARDFLQSIGAKGWLAAYGWDTVTVHT